MVFNATFKNISVIS